MSMLLNSDEKYIHTYAIISHRIFNNGVHMYVYVYEFLIYYLKQIFVW